MVYDTKLRDKKKLKIHKAGSYRKHSSQLIVIMSIFFFIELLSMTWQSFKIKSFGIKSSANTKLRISLCGVIKIIKKKIIEWLRLREEKSTETSRKLATYYTE